MTCENCVHWKRRTLHYVKYINTYPNGEKAIRDDWGDDNHNATKYIYHKNIIEHKTQPSKFGECSHPAFYYTMGGGCIEDDDLHPNSPTDGVIYSDCEAYGAYLYTGQSFSCIHFERNPLRCEP